MIAATIIFAVDAASGKHTGATWPANSVQHVRAYEFTVVFGAGQTGITGVDWALQYDPAIFTVVSRTSDWSPFADVFSVGIASGTDFGGTVRDVRMPVGNGLWLLQDVTITVGNAAGSYALSAIPVGGFGWSDQSFTDQPFDRIDPLIVTVVPAPSTTVPEPEIFGFAAFAAVAAYRFSPRRQRRGHKHLSPESSAGSRTHR